MKYNDHANKYTQEYHKNNLEQIAIRVKKGQKAYYKQAAKNANLSLASFMTTAMDEKLEREQQKAKSSEP